MGFPGDLLVKNLPVSAGQMQVRSLGPEDLPQKERATHSRMLTWEVPWTEEPGRLPSTGSQRVGHDQATKQQQQRTTGFPFEFPWLPVGKKKKRIYQRLRGVGSVVLINLASFLTFKIRPTKKLNKDWLWVSKVTVHEHAQNRLEVKNTQFCYLVCYRLAALRALCKWVVL